MTNIDRETKKMFTLSMILTLCLPIGIPLIIIGAINISKLYLVLALGVVMTVAGFYGSPIVWSKFGNVRALKRVVSAVVEENLYTVQEIAAQLSTNEEKVRTQLDLCFKKQYLVGFKRNGDEILLNENEKLTKREKTAECPYCGAKFSYFGKVGRCPYCGNTQTPEDN